MHDRVFKTAAIISSWPKKRYQSGFGCTSLMQLKYPGLIETVNIFFIVSPICFFTLFQLRIKLGFLFQPPPPLPHLNVTWTEIFQLHQKEPSPPEHQSTAWTTGYDLYKVQAKGDLGLMQQRISRKTPKILHIFCSPGEKMYKPAGWLPKISQGSKGVGYYLLGQGATAVSVCLYFRSTSPVLLCSVLSVCIKTSEKFPLNNHCIIL